MKYVFLCLQGALIGYLAGRVFPGQTAEFWAVLIANGVLTSLYGAFYEDN